MTARAGHQPAAVLELWLQPQGPGAYLATVTFQPHNSPVEEDLAPGEPPRVALDEALLLEHSLDHEAYGAALTAMLFADQRVREALLAARKWAQGAGVPLRLRLRLGADDPALHAVRWELLRDPNAADGRFLCTSAHLLFSRYLPSIDSTPVRLARADAVSALVAVAAPRDLESRYRLAPIDRDAEVASARAALAGAAVTPLEGATLAGLTSALLACPDILYLVCHGWFHGGRPYLLLEGDEGGGRPVDGGSFVRHLSQLDRRPLLVVLASCQSAGQSGASAEALVALGPQLAQAGVGAVVAMHDAIALATVQAGMPVFFAELRRHGQVDRAVAAMRNVLATRGEDWWQPVLFLRLADGALFETAAPGPPEGAGARPAPAATAEPGRPAPPDADWERGYLAWLTGRIARLDAALPLDDRSFPLGDVYTPLRLHQPHSASAEPLRWDALLRAPLVALTGDAGSGKSTLLLYAALQVAQHRRRQLDPAPAAQAGGQGAPRLNPLTLPVLINLASAQVAGVAGPADGRWAPGDQAEPWLRLLADQLRLPPAQAEALLRRGGVLLLVDGLDEVAGADAREQIVEGLVSVQQRFNPPLAPNSVVVSCRQAAWTGRGAFGAFEQIALQPMDAATGEAYLRAWCHAVWGRRAPGVLRRLQNTLRRSPGLARVAQSPQMAAMLAFLEHGKEVPSQRALLYEQFVDRLIRSNREANRAHLVALALEMQRARQDAGERLNEMRYRDVTALLDRRAAAAPAPPGRAGARGEALLSELSIQTGLLEVGERRGLSTLDLSVRFRHRTFQEYLAAYHYFTSYDQERASLLAHATDPAWAEVLAFCCGLLAEYRPASVRDLLEQILQTPDAGAPAEELVRWAPRVAAASVCVTELASYNVDEATLEPVRRAQALAFRLLDEPDERVALATRLQIAEGLGAIYDPRLRDDRRWVRVPCGAFIRGSAADEAWPQEGPPARVTLSELWVQRWPVTVREFQDFLEDPGGYQADQWWDEAGLAWRGARPGPGPKGWEQNSGVKNRPVSGVCWWEARAYCRWYNSVVVRSDTYGLPEGYVVQLPTEAQWEYAAHPGPEAYAGQGALYPWGPEWPAQPCANYARSGLPVEGPTPVGLFPAGRSGRLGLWDAAGNVAEYCLDGFAPYDGAEAADPLCEDRRFGVVVRGGHFRSSGLDLRITARFGAGPGEQLETAGFRCVAVRAPLEGGGTL